MKLGMNDANAMYMVLSQVHGDNRQKKVKYNTCNKAMGDTMSEIPNPSLSKQPIEVIKIIIT